MSQLYEALVATSTRIPQQEAIVEGNTRWTYQTLVAEVDRAATAFQSLNIQPGERVALMLLNQKEFLVSFFALRKIGAVVVPINIQMLPQDIGFVIQNSGTRHMVISDALYPQMSHVPLNMTIVGETEDPRMTYQQLMASTHGLAPAQHQQTADTDLAFLIYTSGTTGYPKGVMLTEKNILTNISGFSSIIPFSDTDRMILALPLFHAYGLIVALVGLSAGATMTLIPKFHPRSILEAAIEENVTILPLVPTLFTVLLELIERQGGVALPSLKFCVSGGASLPTALLNKTENVLKAPVIEGYGMTETSPVLAVNNPQVGSIPGSVGKPLPNVALKILREDNTECAVNEVGEIVVKGDNVMSGYYQLPEDTKAVFYGEWLRTGDLGHLDEAGNLYISGGRKKDLIIKAGENISPRSIEEVLYRHEAVREAAVVGVPHEKLGEDIAACVSLKENYTTTEQELLRHCREHLQASYIPAWVVIMDDLPKNPTGKIIKKALKEQLSQQAALSR